MDGELLEPLEAGGAHPPPYALLYVQGERVAALPAQVVLRDVCQVRIEGGGELRLLLQGVSEHLYTEEPALSDEGEVGGLRVLTSWPLSRAAGPLGGAAEEHAWDMRGERPPVTVASIRLSSGRKPALLACRVGRGAAIAGAHRRHGFHSDAGGEKGGVGQPRN